MGAWGRAVAAGGAVGAAQPHLWAHLAAGSTWRRALSRKSTIFAQENTSVVVNVRRTAELGGQTHTKGLPLPGPLLQSNRLGPSDGRRLCGHVTDVTTGTPGLGGCWQGGLDLRGGAHLEGAGLWWVWPWVGLELLPGLLRRCSGVPLGSCFPGGPGLSCISGSSVAFWAQGHWC